MFNYIRPTVTFENVKDYKGGYVSIFSVKSYGCVLTNNHFVDLHVLMRTIPSFAISIQGLLAKFDAIVRLLIGSLV